MPSDLELNHTQSLSESQAAQNRLLRNIFGIQGEPILQWPGATAWIQHFENSCRVPRNPLFEETIHALGRQSPMTLGDITELAIVIANILRKTEARKISIDGVSEEIHREYGVQRSESHAQNAIRQTIFSIVCLLTTLVQSKMGDSAAVFEIHLPVGLLAVRSSQGIVNSRRPLGSLLRGFGELLPHVVSEHNCGTSKASDLLYGSSLCHCSLKTISKVNIKWVDDLSAHLVFQPLTRTLMLFRFPTFCALSCLGKENGSSFHR